MYFKSKELEKFRSFKGPLIDVRSPSEYYKGHLPNSINIPLFDNDERSIIGTIYKKEGRKNAVIEGLKFLEREIKNLYFVFGNANNILNDAQGKFIIENLKSISFNFPDPWFKKRHNKRRVIQPGFINMLSNSLQKGSLIFIKTDVKDLFDYMDFTISSNFHFKTIVKKDFNYSESFNPSKVKTNREKFVIVNQLDIFERIYIKI